MEEKNASSAVFSDFKGRMKPLFPKEADFYDPTSNIKKLLAERNLRTKSIYFPEGHYNVLGNMIYYEAVADHFRRLIDIESID